LNVDALKAVQTCGQNDTKQCLLRAGPFLHRANTQMSTSLLLSDVSSTPFHSTSNGYNNISFVIAQACT